MHIRAIKRASIPRGYYAINITLVNNNNNNICVQSSVLMDCVPCDIVDGEEGVVGGEVQGVHVAHTLTPRYLNQ